MCVDKFHVLTLIVYACGMFLFEFLLNLMPLDMNSFWH
jgi:hypothetical protein